MVGSARMRSPAPPLAACLAISASNAASNVGVGLAIAAALRGRARAIGVVEVEDRRLREQVGRAEAGRVLGVALDLGRAPLVALSPAGRAPRRAADHRRVVQRHARRHVLGRLARTAGSSRPGGGCSPRARRAPRSRRSGSGSDGAGACSSSTKSIVLLDDVRAARLVAAGAPDRPSPRGCARRPARLAAGRAAGLRTAVVTAAHR